MTRLTKTSAKPSAARSKRGSRSTPPVGPVTKGGKSPGSRKRKAKAASRAQSGSGAGAPMRHAQAAKSSRRAQY